MKSITQWLCLILGFAVLASLAGCRLGDNRLNGRIRDGSSLSGPLQVSSLSDGVFPGQSLTITGEGGRPPYQYTLVSGGGSIDVSTGVFTADSSIGENIVRVTDLAGNSAEISVFTDPQRLLGENGHEGGIWASNVAESDDYWVYVMDADNDGEKELMITNKSTGASQTITTDGYIYINDYKSAANVKLLSIGPNAGSYDYYFLNVQTGVLTNFEGFFSPSESVFDPIITQNGLYAVARVTIGGGGGSALYSMPTDLSSGPIQLNPNLDTGEITYDWALTPDGAKAVYMSNEDGHGGFELFAVDIGNPSSVVPLSEDIGSGGDSVPSGIGFQFKISPNGLYVVYAGAPTGAPFKDNVYSVAIDGSSRTQIKAGSGSWGWGLIGPQFISDSSTVVFEGRFDDNSRTDVFSATVGSAGSAVRMNNTAVANGLVFSLSDSAWFYRTSSMFYTMTIGSFESTNPVFNVAGNPLLYTVAMSPDQSKISFQLDSPSGADEVYVSDYGITGGLKVHIDFPSHVDIGSSPKWLSDSSGVIFMADVAVNQKSNSFLRLQMAVAKWI